jgi:hypothetical protein
MMAIEKTRGINRFIKQHLIPVANNDMGWGYDNGDPMYKDAQDFLDYLAELEKLKDGE